MGRPEKPLDPAVGPHARFALALRALKATAGISYRQMAQMAHFSSSALSEAASGKSLPTLELTLAFVRACGGDLEEWQKRWELCSNEVRATVAKRPLGSRYRLGALLGSGAMGRVLVGVDERGREFAFKVLRSDLVEDSDFVARFVQERSIMLGLRHQNLVAVHDMVIEGDTCAIVMDLVRGGDLREALEKRGTFLPAEVARIGAGIARALAEVHKAGIVHRDVKPENVLLDSSATPHLPRLTDFGVSRLVSGDGAKVGKSTLLAGTPNYVSPEIVNGSEIGPSADLYSLGIMLYELCCGVTPFASASVFQTLRWHGEQLPGRPEGIPDELWDVISSLLHKDPLDRPLGALQVAKVLEVIEPRLADVPRAPKLTKSPSGELVRGNNITVLRGEFRPSLPVPGLPPWFKSRYFWLPCVLVLVLSIGVFVSLSDWFPVGGGAPTMVGKNISELRSVFPESIKVDKVEVPDASKTEGTVIGQEPENGQPLDGRVTLTVTRLPKVQYLDSLTPGSELLSPTGDTGMGGKLYRHSLAAAAATCTLPVVGSAEYNLGKGYFGLRTAVGFNDTTAHVFNDYAGTVEFVGDGTSLAIVPIKWGKPALVDLNLSGVLRLKIQWSVTVPPSTDLGCPIGELIVFGDATLLS